MRRPALRVRPATVGDVPALVAMSEELREQLLPTGEVGLQRTGGAAVRSGLEGRYCDALADPDRHLVVVVDTSAADPEEPVGMALLTVAPANALLDLRAVHVSHSVVADRHRRRGVGRALVAAAAAFAEDRGVEQLVVSVHPGARDANRFFARLGFAPLAVRRVASVAAVRRHLASGELGSDEHGVRLRRPGRKRITHLPLGPSREEEV